MSPPIIDQLPAEARLAWVEGDKVDLQFTVTGHDWSGAWKLQVRTGRSASARLVGELTVVATLNGSDTAFRLTMSKVDSANVVAGTYEYDMEQVAGSTKLSGQVVVSPQVTVV